VKLQRTGTLLSTALGFAIVTAPLVAALAADDVNTPRLDRVGIMVSDIRKTEEFLVSGLGMRVHPLDFGLDADSHHTGGLKLRYVEGNGIWFVLIEPTSPGPALQYLKEKGDGALAELDFEVRDLDAAIEHIEASGVGVVSWDGKPFSGNEKAWTIEPYGIRLVYLDSRGSRGIPIEIYQRGPPDRDLIGKRDRMFEAQRDAPVAAPRLSHINVLVRDLEATARFFHATMHLDPRGASGTKVTTDTGSRCLIIDANGALLELEQPAPASDAMRMLEQAGDGFLSELVYSVANLERSRRTLERLAVSSAGNAASSRTVGCAAKAHGGKHWAIPLNVSRGLRVTLIERP